jgi:hypothetical protein
VCLVVGSGGNDEATCDLDEEDKREMGIFRDGT